MKQSKEIVDMSFQEMLTGLFNIDFLTPYEFETICKAGEMYADAKVRNSITHQNDVEHWVGEQIKYLESIELTSNGEGVLHAYKHLIKIFYPPKQ